MKLLQDFLKDNTVYNQQSKNRFLQLAPCKGMQGSAPLCSPLFFLSASHALPLYTQDSCRPRSQDIPFHLCASKHCLSLTGGSCLVPPSPHNTNFKIWTLPISLEKWQVRVKVTQLCPTLCHPIDYRVHGILQARIPEWVAFPFSRGSSQPRDQTQVSCIAGGFFTNKAMREARFPWKWGL